MRSQSPMDGRNSMGRTGRKKPGRYVHRRYPGRFNSSLGWFQVCLTEVPVPDLPSMFHYLRSKQDNRRDLQARCLMISRLLVPVCSNQPPGQPSIVSHAPNPNALRFPGLLSMVIRAVGGVVFRDWHLHGAWGLGAWECPQPTAPVL